MNITTRIIQIEDPRIPKQYYGTTLGSLMRDLQYEQKLINTQIRDMEQKEKEMKLLEYQLKLPASAQNQTLLSKYGYKTDKGVFEGWEDNFTKEERIEKNVKYQYKVYFPLNDSISVNQRPDKYLIEVKIDSKNAPYDEFIYNFPISRYGDGMHSWVIDYMDTIIDESGAVVSGNTDSFYAKLLNNSVDNYYVNNVHVVKKIISKPIVVDKKSDDKKSDDKKTDDTGKKADAKKEDSKAIQIVDSVVEKEHLDSLKAPVELSGHEDYMRKLFVLNNDEFAKIKDKNFNLVKTHSAVKKSKLPPKINKAIITNITESDIEYDLIQKGIYSMRIANIELMIENANKESVKSMSVNKKNEIFKLYK